MKNYRGIEFAQGINMSLSEFEKVYGSNHIFNNMLPEERKKELKKAYEIATKKEITKPKEEDGNLRRSNEQGENAEAINNQ